MVKLLRAFFVINCVIQIQCSHSNNDVSDKLIDSSDKGLGRELNPKYIEDIVSDLSTAEYSTEDYSKCCGSGRVDCHIPCLDDDQKSFETMFLVTASEVVLGTAIIMGLSALVTILLRICSRPRYPRNTQTNSNVPDEFGRTGIRFSLSSLQQRVMSKLRDRPPRYETRHNYEYQRRETSTTRIPVLNPGAASMANNIPPPAYEPSSDNSSVHELPPAYTIAIEDTGGILNQSFSSDATNAALSDTETSIDSRNRTSDNVLHI